MFCQDTPGGGEGPGDGVEGDGWGDGQHQAEAGRQQHQAGGNTQHGATETRDCGAQETGDSDPSAHCNQRNRDPPGPFLQKQDTLK